MVGAGDELGLRHRGVVENVEKSRKRLTIWIAVFVFTLPLVFAGYQRLYGILTLRAKLHDLKQAGEEADYRKFSRPLPSPDENMAIALGELSRELRTAERMGKVMPPLDLKDTNQLRQPVLSVPRWGYFHLKGTRRIWFTNDWTAFEAEFESHTNLLEKVLIALERPAFHSGQSIDSEWNMEMIDLLWELDGFLPAGFSYRLSVGPPSEADRCIRTLLSASHVLQQEPNSMGDHHSAGMVGTVGSMIWQALRSPSWTDHQLQTWQAALRRVDLVSGTIQSYQLKRALGQERLRRLGGQSGTDRQREAAWDAVRYRVESSSMVQNVYLPLWYALWQEQDQSQNLDAWTANINYLRNARAVGVMKTRRFAHANDGSLPFEPCRHAFPAADSFNSKRYLFGLHDPELSEWDLESVFVRLTEQRLTLTAIAIHRHQLAHGLPPATLSDLLPQFISEMPIDPFDLRPLRYRVLDESWQLYSVGENGIDDGGDPRPIKPKKKFEIPKDMVWPRPARP